MAAVELDEYKRLKDTALEMEKVLAASPHGVNPVAATILANIQKRLVVLEKEIKEAEEKTRSEQAVAAVEAVERETALNREEKSIFAGFMGKEYFTKRDFGQLESFYKTSWDKLTDEGKSDMCKRIDGGIERHEYTLSELPKSVQEKHSAFKQEQKIKTSIQVEHGRILEQKNEDSRSLENLDLSKIDLANLTIADTDQPATAIIQRQNGTAKQNSR